jgi:medium-chain acyl-[acyl-carrier-protein] hydrolase
MGGMPSLIAERKELIRLFLPLFRKDYELFEKYRYVKEFKEFDILSCPILALGAGEDRSVALTALSDWQYFTKASFHQETFHTRNHNYYLEPEFTDTVLQLVSTACTEDALEDDVAQEGRGGKLG